MFSAELLDCHLALLCAEACAVKYFDLLKGSKNSKLNIQIKKSGD